MNAKRLILPAVAAVALLGGYALGTLNTPEPKPVVPAACVEAMDAAQFISQHSRQSWPEAQGLVNAGRLGADPKTRAEAQAILGTLEAQISAREDVLEPAQARLTTALKGCHA